MRILEKQRIDKSLFAIVDMKDEAAADSRDWSHKDPAERLEGLEILRQMWSDYDPDTARLPRFYTLVEQA